MSSLVMRYPLKSPSVLHSDRLERWRRAVAREASTRQTLCSAKGASLAVQALDALRADLSKKIS